MSPATIADGAQRARAIDPQHSFIVQAPAGSGKTELLIQRFLGLLATVRNPDEILAITFTRKAAGEMRARLLQALEGAAGPQPASDHARLTWRLARQALQRDREFGWELKENPGLLTIQTIDSFNASLVRRMPWMSRFGAVPEIAADPFPLYREAARRTLDRLGSGGQGGGEVATVLAHADNRLDLLQEMLVAMLARRDQWLRHLSEKDHDHWRGALERALGEFVAEKLEGMTAAIPAHLHDELLALGRYAAAHLDDRQNPIEALGDATLFPAADPGDLPRWQGLAELLLTKAGGFRSSLSVKCGFPPGKGEPAAMKERMKEALSVLRSGADIDLLLDEMRSLPSPAYPEGQWLILKALVELLPLAAGELWLVFRQEGQTDFASVAMQALSALGSSDDPTELLLRLDARISHILVDEFQDTSYLQYNLLQKLTAGWESGDGRTLFVVGDPMQSIYLFREAEVGLFLRARSRGIGSLNLERLDLCSNFRSQQGVVEWVNGSFSRLFPEVENEATGGVVYSEATAVHEALSEAACTAHPFAARDDVAEAEAIAGLAARALDEHPDQTVAVLVRARTHLPEILAAFRRRGLRFSARDIDLLECRPAVKDILALTRALLHSADRLSWLTVLRAPWCGLLLEDLYALCGAEKYRTLPELMADPQVLQRLSEDGRLRIERVLGVMTRGMARRGATGLRRLVEGCWLALGGGACHDEAGIHDAAMVFALMEEHERGGDLLCLDALEEGARKLFAAADAGADGRLQVMTIHKSKGLEFDTVILPGLGRSSAGGDRPLLRWLEHTDCGLLLAPVAARDGRSKDPIYEAIGKLSKEKGNLETTRLLYVAATRAKKRLHLLGHAKAGKNAEYRPAAGSLLEKLWPVVAEAFTFSEQEMGEKEEVAKERVPIPVSRLPLSWDLPPMCAAPLATEVEATAPSRHKDVQERDELFTGWEAETARHVGTVAHAYLERIAAEGLEAWSAGRIDGEGEAIRLRLNGLGVPSYELDGGTNKVADALKKALASRRGQWILGPREGAGCEKQLSGVVGGSLVHAIIDRTFVEDGVRWIVDYKVAEAGAQADGFLQQQAEKYRSQLSA